MTVILRPTRRGIIGGLGVLFAAPAIVRASSLMQVKALPVAPAEIVNEALSADFLQAFSSETLNRYLGFQVRGLSRDDVIVPYGLVDRVMKGARE